MMSMASWMRPPLRASLNVSDNAPGLMPATGIISEDSVGGIGSVVVAAATGGEMRGAGSVDNGSAKSVIVALLVVNALTGAAVMGRSAATSGNAVAIAAAAGCGLAA